MIFKIDFHKNDQLVTNHVLSMIPTPFILPLFLFQKKRPVVATLDAERLLSVISSEFDTCSLQQNHNSQNLRSSHLNGPHSQSGGRKTSMQWSLSRINPEAHFTLGSRANKALGLGTTRYTYCNLIYNHHI